MDSRGFTLIETLIYVGIIGLVTASLFGFAWSVSNNRNKAYSAQEVQENIRLIGNLLPQYFNQAEAVLAPTPGNISANAVLDMPDPELNLTIAVTDGRLGVSQGAGDPQALTSAAAQISNLSFQNLAAIGEKDNLRLTATVSYRQADSKSFGYSQDIQLAFTLKK